MPLTPAQMAALINDNTAGDVTPADHRAVNEALYQYARWPFTADAEDVEWDDDDLAGFTAITPGGSQTLVEEGGHLSVKFSGQAIQTFNARVKARSFSVGDSFAVPVRLLAPSADFNMVGLVFSDGATTTDDMVALIVEVDSSGGLQLLIRSGTFDTVGSFGTIAVVAPEAPMPELWIRMTYQAANTWRLAFSPDGLSWIDMELADESVTLTPTHFGLCWSVYGGTHESIVNFGPIRKLA